MSQTEQTRSPSIKRDWMFLSLLAAVVLTFAICRPLNSPFHPFIAGDGLGYYAHLPATFIYGDHEFRYEWFNKVHDANYAYSAFPDPSKNLLVEHNGRYINKFYPGLSVAWLPFFATAHLAAKLLGYPADGFSRPYQLAIGLASLFYILLGLYLLRSLLLRNGIRPFIACVVCAAYFSGTWLFQYSVDGNALSHAYSFTFITGFLLSVCRLKEMLNGSALAWCFLFFALTVTVRPLDGLIIFAAPAFIRLRALRNVRSFVPRGGALMALMTAVFTFAAFIYINFRQTGSLFSYTYSDEKFDFSNPHLADALFSYHMGVFVYAPVVFLSFTGLVRTPRRIAFLALLYLAVTFINSCWWYWPVVKRGMIDFYVIPALFLGFGLNAASGRMLKAALLLVLLCIIYFQFKSMQFRRGILHEFSTHGELFWRHFFRTKPADIYPVPPSSILRTETFAEGFESKGGAMLLDSTRYIAPVAVRPFPSWFAEQGSHKVRLSFRMRNKGPVTDVHVFFQFIGKNDSTLAEIPFYMGPDHLSRHGWDLREFGHEILPSDSLTPRNVKAVSFIAWNVSGKGLVEIDDAKVEFILADRSFETVK